MRRNNQDINNHQHNGKVNPYILFGAVGIVSILASVSFYFLKWDIWGQLFLNLGASALVVIIVEFVWRKFGGDPVIRAISSLWRATNLLRELETSGINSIKTQRRQLESQEQITLWCSLLGNATHVDLMAWSMKAQITRYQEILKAIEKAIRSNRCQVRVLTLCPFQEISECNALLIQRINEEKRLPGGESAVDRIRGNLTETWSQFNKIKDMFKDDPERKNCLQIQAATEIIIYTNIIRIDDRMWVSPYSASVRGGENPVFEIAGMHSALFQRFHNEFNHMWDPPPKC